MEPYADEKALAAELELARKAIEAGASFVITPPVYDPSRFVSFLDQAKGLGVPIIAKVYLIKSVGIARYIAQTEAGAHISEEMIKRIRKAPDRDTECLRIAGEIAAGLKSLVQGVHFVTTGWEHRLPAILDFAGL
jgi:methylenetetrahydrofolate reductase (NADPH)